MQNNKTTLKEIQKSPYKIGRTIVFLVVTLFGVFFLSGMGLITNDYVGAGLLGGQLWFFWTVVAFLVVMIIIFSAIIIRWALHGLPGGVIRSLHLYCWSLLFVCSFVIGLQSATFGALNSQVINLTFTTFGNIFSMLWIILVFFVTGLWVFAAASRSHLEEHPYKVLRNYFFWIIAFSLFIFHFEQASSGALGVNTEKVLLNTDLGDTITSSLITFLSKDGNALNFISHQVFMHKDFFGLGRLVTEMAIKNTLKFAIFKPYIWGNESLIVFSLISTLFGKGAFWGLNNSWSGWTIFVTVITVNIWITAYAFTRFVKKDVHNVDNPFFVKTPLYVIFFTIFMYAINAYIVTFISGGHLNPGIVGSHIGHLQQDIPEGAGIIQIIQGHWMFNIMKYPVGDVFAGSYRGTWWWWTEEAISMLGLNVIIFGCLLKHRRQIKKDFLARRGKLKLWGQIQVKYLDWL